MRTHQHMNWFRFFKPTLELLETRYAPGSLWNYLALAPVYFLGNDILDLGRDLGRA